MYYLVPVDRLDFIKHGYVIMPHQELCNRTVVVEGFSYMRSSDKTEQVKYYAFHSRRDNEMLNMNIHLRNLLMELTIMKQDQDNAVLDHRIQETNELLAKFEKFTLKSSSEV